MKNLFLVFVLGVIVACAAPSAENPFALAETKWLLVSMTRDSVTETPAVGRNVTLDFSNDGRVGGSAGCNSFGGTYETQGEILKISTLQITLMACLENDVMEFESAYVDALQNAQLFEKRANELSITFANGSGRLRFVRRE